MKKRVLSFVLVLAMVLGTLPVLASAQTQTPAIKSVQMVLDSILNINLKADLCGNPAENYTMEVTVGDSATQILTGIASGDVYVYTANLMAHQMTDTVSIVFKNGETVLEEKTWTVASYVDAIVNDSAASAEAKALVQDMYYYGQYAAYYKNGGNDPAIDAVIGATAVDSANKLELRKNNAALGAVAYLYLDEACDLGFKFNKEAMTGLSLYVDDALVTPADLNDTQVQYKIQEILPQGYDVKHTVQVKDGEELVFDLSYSVLSYIYQSQKKADSQDSLQLLLKSMTVYGTGADAYCETLPVYLTAANAGTPELFAATINAAPAKEYFLAEDLNWTDLSTENYNIPVFDGILDGQGHSIKGFTMSTGGDGAGNYHTCLFGTNNGTIKNIAFDYSVAVGAGNTMGLVAINKGTVENLFVKAAFAGYSWTTGAIVATNDGTGTVQNCITTVSSTLADQAAKDRLGSIAGADYNGKIINCYAVNTENSVTTPYAEGWNNGDYTGSVVYADNASLLAGADLSAANGWASYWTITEGGIAFNGEIVIAGTVTPPCEHQDASPVDGICDLCGKEVAAPEGTYFINSETAATVADFVALINADLDGTYYVTEDLDYSASAENTTGIADFAGILDGQGHTVKGIKIKYNSNHEFESNLFKSNSGMIKDIAMDYSIVAANGNITGLVGTNTGLIQNVYAKVTMTADGCSRAYGNNSPLVAINDSETAVIKNCIVDVTVDASVTAIPETYGVVASRNDNGATIDKCYYRVEGTTFPSVAYPWSAQNVAALDASVTSLPAADGWSECWKANDTGLYFGSTLIMAAAPKCDHVDASPIDGKCDICGEAVALPEGTYLINSTTAATVADFVALINADLDGTFYVTEDLDYSSSGDNSTGVADFAGILDGQGHTVKGIKIKYNSNHEFESNLFKSNSGAIMNIAFEHSIVAANGNATGLIGTNTGMIQNVYAKVTMTADGCSRAYGNNSPFVALNDGDTAIIQNCIVDVTVDSTVTSIPETYGAIVAKNDNTGATVDKCYYRVTGAAMPGIAYPWSTLNDAKVLDASVTSLPAADGWSDCWKADDTGLYFGSTLIMAAAPKCDHVDASPIDGKCDICGEAVALPEGTYLINSTTAATAADLAALINADLDGIYYVTEDLTYAGSVGIGEFAGILDGQGHSIKGINVALNGEGGWTANMISVNSGLIQNIALEYTITATNNDENAFVGTNKGMIQNVYAKVAMNAVKDQYGTNSALVGINDGDSAAIVKNCIVNVIVDASITSFPDTYGAVVSRNANGATIDKCYYRVEGTAMPGIAYPWSTLNDAKVLDTSVTSLPAADGWSNCWKANAAGIWFGDIQILDNGIALAEEAIAVHSSYEASNVTNDTIANKGATEDDRANIFAWYDFQKLYQEITGKAIEVVFVDSVDELDANKSYFILGDDLANEAGHTNSGITMDNGHKIVKSGDDVYLYGKSGYGTANAMYAFLKQAFGAEFYSDTVYTTTGSTFSIDSISNATFNPSVDYNWAYDGLLYSNNGEAINYAYQMRLGFVNYWQIQSGSFHAFSELFANSNYSVDVDLNAGGTIGPDSTYVRAVADYVYEKATSGKNKSVIAVGPADTHTWSTSSASQANLNTYGANSGEYLLFMNAVIELLNTDEKYANIPAVDVAMLVYNGSLAAPTSNLDALTPNTNNARGVNLKAMFAPIEMNINGTPTDSTIKDYYGNTPSYYYDEYAKWQNIFGADNVYFWRYSTIFNDFMVPVNTVKYIQENYQAVVGSDNYIKHMMDQGTGISPAQTNFQALLVYLKSQLGKNANADMDTLITSFCNAYYGTEAGGYIKQLLTAEQSHLTTLSTTMNNTSTGFLGTGKKADISGCHSVPDGSGWFSNVNNLYAAKWWSSNCSDDDGAMLRTWYGYITSALAATDDADQQARIQVEAIALRYISLKAHGVALISGDTLAKVEADAISLGITRYSEGQTIENLA